MRVSYGHGTNAFILSRQENWEASPKRYPYTAPYEWREWHDARCRGWFNQQSR